MDAPSVSGINKTPYGPGFEVVFDEQHRLLLAFCHLGDAEKAQEILKTIFGIATHVEVSTYS